MEEKIKRLERLLEISLELSSTLYLRDLLGKIVRLATELTDTEASSILLLDRKTRTLYFEAATGVRADSLLGIPVPLEGSIAGRIVQEGNPVIVEDVKADPGFYGLVDALTHFQTRSILGVPLKVKDMVIGALEVLNKRGGKPFSQEDVRLLEILAAQAAVAIENARLFQQSDFISDLVHELRTPLTAIMGYSQLMLSHEFDPATKRRFLETIHREAARLSSLVNDFLDLVRLESGRAKINKKPVQLRQLLEECVAILRPQADSRRIKVKLTVPPLLPLVPADEDRLRRVVINLLSNAIKFNRDEGSVEIKVEMAEGEVRVSVSDTGVGISPEEIPHIFEKFYRGRAEGEVPGSGLGLSIARQIVEAHGGKIWVESTLDQGSTFTFSIPLGGSQ
ncbi:MAG: GAF domain-containing sensor histidine kinase [Anaerolineae bacterium]|nr:GAF domain-containing sensor histidine kinase [Anaerolineae bacterium]MDW8102817.1 GAF domain-containing sensor histidine kinase [Anaerolineae bacterium]